MSFVCKVCEHELQDNMESQKYLQICQDCETLPSTPVTNEDWITMAETNDLALYSRQPLEADSEWLLWNAFSGMYPETKPSIRAAANMINMSYSNAKLIASKWDYNVRIQEYKMFVDEQTKKERALAVKEMNAKHISMAQKLQGKLEKAIENIDPFELKPGDLNALLKTMNELERKAHLDKEARELVEYTPNVSNTKTGQKEVAIKKDDMAEILSILSATGQLNNKTIGVETTTTRVIAREE